MKRALAISFGFVAAITVVWLATVALAEIFNYPLVQFGILPRSLRGLIGILFSPFLHGDAKHLGANAAPLFVLLTILFWNLGYRPASSLALIWFGSGLGTWLIGRGETWHIGASGLIYGLAAYLIAAGFLMKSWRSAIIAVVIFFLYGGIFWGVLPQDAHVSWEGHLSGAFAGIWAARKAHR